MIKSPGQAARPGQGKARQERSLTGRPSPDKTESAEVRARPCASHDQGPTEPPATARAKALPERAAPDKAGASQHMVSQSRI